MGDVAAHRQRLLQPADERHQFPGGHSSAAVLQQQHRRAVNYGAIGAVIGHELTHGFDDEGRQFDATGQSARLVDASRTPRRSSSAPSCVANEYSQFTAVGRCEVERQLTLGENTADNGGVRSGVYGADGCAWAARPKPKLDGFTDEQRFFLGYGTDLVPELTARVPRMLATVDPHSPGRYRVNGVLQTIRDFAKAFSCKQVSRWRRRRRAGCGESVMAPLPPVAMRPAGTRNPRRAPPANADEKNRQHGRLLTNSQVIRDEFARAYRRVYREAEPAVAVNVSLAPDLVRILQSSDKPLDESVRELIVLELCRQGRISSGMAGELLGLTRMAFVQFRLIPRHPVL